MKKDSYLPLITTSILTLFVSVVFPILGNPLAVFIGSAGLIIAGGSNRWMLYLPVGILASQLPVFMARGFDLGI